MIKHATIQDKKIDSERTVQVKQGPNKGQSKKVWNCSLKIEGKWYKGSVWDKTKFDTLGETVYLNMFKKEWQGEKYWNWKLASEADIMEFRIQQLEQEVKMLKGRLTK